MIKRYIIPKVSQAGTACNFDTSTNISSGAFFYQETMNLVGAPGALVTLQVSDFNSTNSAGALYIDGVLKTFSDRIYVTLDGSGNGSFVARVEGDPIQTGTIVYAIMEIDGVSSGYIGTNNTKTISKTF